MASQEPMPLGLKLILTGLFAAMLVGVYFGGRADGRDATTPQGTTIIRKAFELSAESAVLVWTGERCYTRLEVQGRILASPLDTRVCENLAISTTRVILVPSDTQFGPGGTLQTPQGEPEPGIERAPAGGPLQVDGTGYWSPGNVLQLR